jgi:hypothetical protein
VCAAETHGAPDGDQAKRPPLFGRACISWYRGVHPRAPRVLAVENAFETTTVRMVNDRSICMTPSTSFCREPRGLLDVKGKGAMETYFVYRRE